MRAATNTESTPAELQSPVVVGCANVVARWMPSALCLLIVLASMASVLSNLTSTAPALIVPVSVVVAAVVLIGVSRGLTKLREILAVVVALGSRVPIRPTPTEDRSPGQIDPCRRVEAILLAGPRAPGMAAAHSLLPRPVHSLA